MGLLFVPKIMRALGIPMNMFTTMFAIGRAPGYIANWREVASQPKGRIYRPRQVYVGAPKRDYVPIAERKAAASSSRGPYTLSRTLRPSALMIAAEIGAGFTLISSLP